MKNFTKVTLAAAAITAATATAPAMAAPIDLQHDHTIEFSRVVDSKCGVNVKSPNGFGKLLITGEDVEPNRAPRFELVNNGANYPAGTKTDVQISVESNGIIKNAVGAAKYDVFLAKAAGFGGSAPIADFEGDKAPTALKDMMEWNEEYRAQLRLHLTDDQKKTLKAQDNLLAKLKLKIEC